MLSRLSLALVWLLSVPIRVYRGMVSPWLPPACRYEPSCSRYALEALSTHGPIKGLWLAAHRLARCHPWGGFGYDPVPPRVERPALPNNPKLLVDR